MGVQGLNPKHLLYLYNDSTKYKKNYGNIIINKNIVVVVEYILNQKAQ